MVPFARRLCSFNGTRTSAVKPRFTDVMVRKKNKIMWNVHLHARENSVMRTARIDGYLTWKT